MSEAHHDLAHELPEYRDRIPGLKTSDEHFAKLYGDYHELAKELHRIEIGAETPEDAYVEELKRKRLAIKDELAAMLRDA